MCLDECEEWEGRKGYFRCHPAPNYTVDNSSYDKSKGWLMFSSLSKRERETSQPSGCSDNTHLFSCNYNVIEADGATIDSSVCVSVCVCDRSSLAFHGSMQKLTFQPLV